MTEDQCGRADNILLCLSLPFPHDQRFGRKMLCDIRLFPDDSVAASLRWATTGVVAPLTGIIGARQRRR